MPKRLATPWLAIILAASAGFPRLAAPTALAAEVDKQALADLRESGPPAWRAMASYVRNISVTCEERRVDTTQDGSKPTTTAVNAEWLLCWNRESSTRLLERRDLGSGLLSVRVANPKYRFTVSKVRDEPSYRLDAGKRFVPGSPQGYDTSEEQFNIRLEAGIRVQGIPIEELLSDKEFRPTRAEYLPDPTAADRRLALEWQYLGSEGRSRHAGGVYRAELSPRQSWRIERSGVRVPATGREWSQEITYQETEAGIPFPGKLQVTLSIPRAKLKSESVYTFGKPTDCRRSGDEFFLAHYRIPETALGYPGPSVWPRVLLVGSGLGGLIALFVASRARKRRIAH